MLSGRFALFAAVALSCVALSNAGKCFVKPDADGVVTAEQITAALTTRGKDLTHFPTEAFKFCHDLKTITLPDSIETMGNRTFYRCWGLETVTLPKYLKTMGDDTFDKNKNLTSVTIPSLETMGDNTFENCGALVDVTLPNSLTEMGSRTFAHCGKLESVTFSNKLEKLGSSTFHNNWALVDVSLPDSLAEMGSGTFYGCSVLESVTLPNSLETMGDNTFFHCYDIKYVCGATNPSFVAPSLIGSSDVNLTEIKSRCVTKVLGAARSNTNPDSWEDATMICPAGRSDINSCVFPVVTSDDQDGVDTSANMTLTVEKFNRDTGLPDEIFNCTNPGSSGCSSADVIADADFDFDQTGYYIFTYNAKDAYGNTAENVVFSLFLDDWVAPTIDSNPNDLNVQACNSECENQHCTATPFQAFTAKDRVSGNLTADITYSFHVGNKKEYLNMDFDTAEERFRIEQAHPTTIVVTGTVSDNAGVFGQGGTANTVHKSYTFEIVDNTLPVITVTDPSNSTHECAKYDYTAITRDDELDFAPFGKFADPGAQFFDVVSCTSEVNNVTSNVDTKAVGDYTIKYDASGWNHQNAAVQKTRNVKVQDTTPPYIKLLGPASIEVHQYDKNSAYTTGIDTEDDASDLGTLKRWTATSLNDNHLNQGGADGLGVEVWDECSDIVLANDVNISYYGADGAVYTSPKNMIEATGTYTIVYTVTDNADLESSINRTIVVVDRTAPIIRTTVERIYVEFKDGTYTPPTATCKDYNSAELTVSNSTDYVDNSVLGTYHVTFHCTDGADNAADDQIVTVIVRDTTAPTFVMSCKVDLTTDTTILGEDLNDIRWGNVNLEHNANSSVSICEESLEAGFPFKDPSGIATDHSATSVTVSNNIVTESSSKAWNMESCKAIKSVYANATKGYYFITTSLSSAIGKVRVECSDMDTSDAKTTRKCEDDCVCSDLGMVVDSSDDICTVTPSADTPVTGYAISHDAVVSGAHLTVGTYFFQYYVVDAEGNTNDCWNHGIKHSSGARYNRAIPYCQGDKKTYVRFITVTDNLPPVITLHDRASTNTVLYANATDVSYAGNPFVQGALMAEQSSSVNGWVIAAAGFAAAGLALMAVSSPKASVLPVV